MMDGPHAARRVQSAVNQYGSSIVLRRRVGTTSSFTSASIKATKREYQPTEGVRMSEVPGDKESGDQVFTVSALDLQALSWPVPPVKGDFVVAQGRTWAVLGAEEKIISDVLCAWLLHARGG